MALVVVEILCFALVGFLTLCSIAIKNYWGKWRMTMESYAFTLGEYILLELKDRWVFILPL